jgi:hypothetical protein
MVAHGNRIMRRTGSYNHTGDLWNHYWWFVQ